MDPRASGLKRVYACAVAVLLAGCAGSSTGGNSVPIRSWMSPQAKSGDLIYTTDIDLNEVFVLSYQTGKLVGTIAGLSQPMGVCSDREGDVYVTDGDQILEYAHGGTQALGTLSDPGASADSCAVDPVSGNLAVT